MSEGSSSSGGERLIIRPYSDIIYLYPSLIAAVACGLWVSMSGATVATPGASGIVFTLIFFFNLSIVAFDYTRLTSIVIALIVVIMSLVSAMYPGFGTFLHGLLNHPIFMDTTFYWVWASGLGVTLAATLVKTRFDYWEIKNNELLHHHGLLGDVERWPAPNMRISKEIRDVMEYLLFRSGRLVLMPSREPRAIIIDNVPNISKVEVKMQRILGTLSVADND